MIRNILVPLDGSEFGEHALPMAAALARKSGAMMHLVHVHGEESWTGERDYLDRVAARLAAVDVKSVETAILDGPVAPALKDFARRALTDLVVMSTHGRGAFGRMCLGSIADELTAALNVPVLLVRPGDGLPDLAAARGLRSIVVPLDGTPLAEKAIEPAMALGLPFDAEFHLVRVNTPALLASYLPEGAGSHTVAALIEEASAVDRHDAELAEAYLTPVAERMRARGARVETHVVLEGRTAAGILAEADADRADLIAVETHGRRGFARFFMGSTADDLVRTGAVPVLLHHAAG